VILEGHFLVIDIHDFIDALAVVSGSLGILENQSVPQTLLEMEVTSDLGQFHGRTCGRFVGAVRHFDELESVGANHNGDTVVRHLIDKPSHC
jgi:hypothetical protein